MEREEKSQARQPRAGPIGPGFIKPTVDLDAIRGGQPDLLRAHPVDVRMGVSPDIVAERG
jgi:hypothetical protein